MQGVEIVATGRAIPKKAVTNDDLAKIIETNDEWIVTRTGIKKRRCLFRFHTVLFTDMLSYGSCNNNCNSVICSK